MDSFEWNKISGWVLAALIAVLGLGIVTGMIYNPHTPEKAAYEVQGVEQEASEGPAVAGEKPIAFYLATADVAKGEAQFKKCAACHTIDKGGANGIGPNLYGIFGKPHGHAAGFAYSDALKSKQAPWDWNEMSEWLKSPKTYAPGTKMSFAGLGKPEDRAALLVYLNQKSDSPLPLPPVPAEEPAAAAAPVADAAPTAISLLASADVAKGEAQYKKCAACHTINKGGANGIGPNLYGIVGAKHAHSAGFAYSDAIKSKPGNWDFAALDQWLEAPKAYAPGTKMSFAGISKPQDRAALIAYLNTQSDAPLPLPAQ